MLTKYISLSLSLLLPHSLTHSCTHTHIHTPTYTPYTHVHTHTHTHTHTPQSCILQIFDTREVNVCQNQQLADEFALNIRNIFLFLESRIGEANEIGHRQKLVGFCGLLVLHNQLYNVPDRKLVRQVWDIYKKIRKV